MEVPFGLDRPGWIEDPDFDIDAHLRRIGVPPPGGPEQLGNLIGELVAIKLDRRKPLWEFWVIDGLEGDRIAILAKVHHSIIDGVSGSELASVLFDLEPSPPEPPPPEEPRLLEQLPDSAGLFFQGLGDVIRTPWRITRLAGQSIRQGLTFLGFQRQSSAPAAPVPGTAHVVQHRADTAPAVRVHQRAARRSQGDPVGVRREGERCDPRPGVGRAPSLPRVARRAARRAR